MILTENDLVCFVEDPYDEEFPPEEYLKLKENIVSKVFLYYSLDDDNLNIISCIDDYSTKFFYNNLIFSNNLNLVDNIHGLLRNCSVNNIEFNKIFNEAPEAKINIRVNNIVPWEEEPCIDMFNIDAKYFGILNQQKVQCFSADDFYVKDLVVGENLIDKTISLSVNVFRNEDIKFKQIVCFEKNFMYDDIEKLIENIKFNIMFNYNNQKDILKVKIGNFYINVKDVQLEKITHVFDFIDFPNNFHKEEYFIFAIYYSGKYNNSN